MILKIASGAFLGIIAILIALKIPAWIVERRAMHVICAFTPDTVIARCGKPVSDNEHTFHTVSLRDMAYEGAKGKVILHFGKIAKQSGVETFWILNYMDGSLGGTTTNTSLNCWLSRALVRTHGSGQFEGDSKRCERYFAPFGFGLL